MIVCVLNERDQSHRRNNKQERHFPEPFASFSKICRQLMLLIFSHQLNSVMLIHIHSGNVSNKHLSGMNDKTVNSDKIPKNGLHQKRGSFSHCTMLSLRISVIEEEHEKDLKPIRSPYSDCTRNPFFSTHKYVPRSLARGGSYTIGVCSTRFALGFSKS